MQNVQMSEQNFMMLKSTFDLFDRDGGGEVDTDEVKFSCARMACVGRRSSPMCN
jgi:Ca2+-binding EF-hand superfamily protein